LIVHKVIRVHGRVQGVGFRFFTVRVARVLGLKGSVANLPDGSVEVVAEGEEGTVRALVDRLREGPPASRVERLDVRNDEVEGKMAGFEIVDMI